MSPIEKIPEVDLEAAMALDPAEWDILRAYENDEFVDITSDELIEKFRAAARATRVRLDRDGLDPLLHMKHRQNRPPRPAPKSWNASGHMPGTTRPANPAPGKNTV